MRVIPVIDVLNGLVVRGVGGRRDEYRPIQSVWTQSTEPLEVARALRGTYGTTSLYLADLDAILHDDPHHDLYGALADDGFDLLVDAGVRSSADVDVTLTAGAQRAVIGLETWPTLASLELLVRKVGAERVVFSLDLKQGQPLARFRDMLTDDPLDIALAVVEAGVQQMIVLDLAAVGMKSGSTTIALCRELKASVPTLSLITGGGVRHADDLSVLKAEGLDGVLVASALHDGNLQPRDVRL